MSRWAIVVAVALALGAVVLATQRSADAKLDVDLRVSTVVVPRQQPSITLKLRSSSQARVQTSLLGADGGVLARGRSVQLRPGRTTIRTLRPTPLGLRELGRCGKRRLTVVARSDARRSRHVSVTTQNDRLRCSPLRWAPPPLEAPETIALGKGFGKVSLKPDRDYVLRLPRGRKLGGTFIEGGRNVVIIGGHISVPPGTTIDEERRALYFKNQTGTVHVEGVLIDGSGGGEGDGIAIAAPQAIVQIENSRIVGLRGSEDGTHADVVQPWGGVRELRIDRLTASSRFQGLFLPVLGGPVGPISIRNAELRSLTPFTRDRSRPGRGSGGTMLWLTAPGTCALSPVSLERVYIVPRAERRTVGQTVWPGVRDGSRCPARQRGKKIDWPKLPVRGRASVGVPEGGDYVPQPNVGRGYRTPGYEGAG